MKESYDQYLQSINSLSRKIFIEPTSRNLRPYIVEYIHLHINRAKSLSENDLLEGEGNDISSSICGALAWQGADGVEGEAWVNEIDEPKLWKILEIAGKLDVDSNDLTAWHKLFELVDNL